jgi:uncharacterized membrane protein YfcA
MLTPDPLRTATILLASVLGGAANSVAGGGTLLTFPALIGLGVPPVVANATSTVALWPGALSSLWGYRAEVAGARRWARALILPSVLGGLVGAWLLLVGGDAWFERMVPWLVFGATLLFVAQRPVLQLVARRRATTAARAGPPEAATEQEATVRDTASPEAIAPEAIARDAARHGPTWKALVFQFFVAIYGGYFGAGAGILTLASLGIIGFTNIHRMNGLKNWTALCFNAVAILSFALWGVIDWPLAALMSVGTTIGGYGAAGLARRAPQALVRNLVAAIGFASAAWLLVRR